MGDGWSARTRWVEGPASMLYLEKQNFSRLDLTTNIHSPQRKNILWTSNVGLVSEEGDARGLPQPACQITALLNDKIRGYDPKVDGEQLEALYHFQAVVLAVVSQ